MVLGGSFVLFVSLIGNVIDGVGRIDSHTPLNATSGHLTEEPGHILLLVQILLALMDMAESIDLLPGEMRLGRTQTFMFRIGGIIESQPHCVYRRHLDLVIPSDPFAVQIKVSPHLPQPFDVLLLGSHFF
jgi:hypothetical protein